jgi:hypothetical protein
MSTCKKTQLLTPPSLVMNLIPSAGDQTKLVSNFGTYKSVIAKELPNTIGNNMAALEFESTYLNPQVCSATTVSISPYALNVPSQITVPKSTKFTSLTLNLRALQ